MISELQQPLDSGFGAKSEPSEVLEGIDLNGKTALVTGGYSGIGLETTRALSNCGARVIVPARRRDVARKELEGIIDKEDVLNLDLADPSSVTKFVDEFLETGTNLDILINNAAVMACPQMPTDNGWDLQFAVNHIGHFILTKGLIPSLLKSGDSRVVTLSSTGHKLSGIRWDDIHFAWAGNGELGHAHYYRVQSEQYLAEYDNTQNDANHIHAVWRDANWWDAIMDESLTKALSKKWPKD